ncbi:MAG TPA: DNA-processing protein DprA [Candidatus Limnocylindrales bacterium]
MAERDAWTVLASIPGLGPVGLGALLRRHGSGRSILEVAAAPGSVGRLTVADERGRALVDGSLAARIAEAALAAPLTLDRVRAAGLLVLTLEDAAYPARLRAIEMPPHVLFVRGSPAALAAERAVAVVGTRRPTERGRRLAGRLAAALARAGASIVSGLAVGIDGAAHAAAVSVGGPTVAVLGSGHERLFPRAHARLADAIVDAGGAIVSELPPEAPAAGWTFPRRNRVVSGLSEACLVVEAPLRSGALITAGWALEQGRECFLVPGPLDEPASAGCLAFLRAYGPQARLVADVAGLLEDLGLTGGQDGPAAAPPSAGRGTRRPASAAPRAGAAALLAELGEAERASAVALIRGRSTVDELVAATEQPVATVLGTLTLLEMRGLVVTAYGRYRPAGALATLDPSAVVARLSGRPAGG